MKRIVRAITNSFATIFDVGEKDRKERLRALKHMEGRVPLMDAEFGHQNFPPSEAQIAAQVRAIFAKHIDVNVSQAHPDDKLVEDLRMDALDSMSTVEFLLELEDHFGVAIPESAAAQMRTLRDLTGFILHALKSKGCSQSNL
jgi:acyl carrier protein